MRIHAAAIRLGLLLSLAGTACTSNKMVPATDSHTDHGAPSPSAVVVSASNDPRLPPDASGALARLSASPRHGEWVILHTGGGDSLRAWVVYPERSTKAPVVVVVHEIFGLSDWIRGVADQLAADGFIAVAPDLLSGHGANGGDSSSLSSPQETTQATLTLAPSEILAKLGAARQYGLKLPSANGKSGSVGFCFGGNQSFAFA